MELKNSYNAEQFEEDFSKSLIYSQLVKDFKDATFLWKAEFHFSTPREEALNVVVHLKSFYYISYLTDKNPKIIYDLGCGYNFFKRYIPNIHGVGAERKAKNFFGDEYGFVDDNYIAEHQNYFDSVFSINALHFRPLSEFEKIITDFMSMVKPGGTGYLAMNAARGWELSIKAGELAEVTKDTITITHYLEDIIQRIGTEKFTVIDLNIHNRPDSAMSGNIHLVFTKPHQQTRGEEIEN